jgi:hypothetical protein
MSLAAHCRHARPISLRYGRASILWISRTFHGALSGVFRSGKWLLIELRLRNDRLRATNLRICLYNLLKPLS